MTDADFGKRERAAIMEFDGGITRAEADRLAGLSVPDFAAKAEELRRKQPAALNPQPQVDLLGQPVEKPPVRFVRKQRVTAEPLPEPRFAEPEPPTGPWRRWSF